MEAKSFASRTDKLCVAAIVALWFGAGLIDMALDAVAFREAKMVDKPLAEAIWEEPMNRPQLLEAIEIQLEQDFYRADIPLDQELQAVLWEACEANGVPIYLALGLIEVESGFDPEADSGVSKGLMQLNERYFPSDLSPEDNIWAGVAYLGELLERYGDTQAALTAYNAGYDTGDRTYARAVLAASEKWGDG